MVEAPSEQTLQSLSQIAPSTPEFRLLLACSHVPPHSLETVYSSKTAALCSDAGPLDWDVFLGLVDRHHIPILAYAMLRRRAWELIPERIKSELASRYKKPHRKALKHTLELVRLAGLFSSNGIELLPLKGPLLSQHLYGDPGMRQSADLDVMVKRDDVDRAEALLLKEGYRRVYPELNLSERQKRVFLSVGQHYTYRHIDGQTATLDLHWRFCLWAPEQIDELWKHSRPVEWAGAHFRQLSEEMLLLCLCDHGSRHRWWRIKWLGDVAAMLSRCSGMNWTGLVQTAERLDLKRSLAQTALLVHLLYETPPAEPLLTLATQEKQAVRLARRSLEVMSMTEQEHDVGSFSGRCKDKLYRLGLRAKLSRRYFLQDAFFDPETWQLVQLPDDMLWLHYLLHLPMSFKRRYIPKA